MGGPDAVEIKYHNFVEPGPADTFATNTYAEVVAKKGHRIVHPGMMPSIEDSSWMTFSCNVDEKGVQMSTHQGQFAGKTMCRRPQMQNMYMKSNADTQPVYGQETDFACNHGFEVYKEENGERVPSMTAEQVVTCGVDKKNPDFPETDTFVGLQGCVPVICDEPLSIGNGMDVPERVKM